MTLLETSAAGWTKPIGNYTASMRRAVLALEAEGAVFLPGRGGWIAGDLVLLDVTIRALRERNDVAVVIVGNRPPRVKLTARGEATLAAIRRKQAEAA